MSDQDECADFNGSESLVVRVRSTLSTLWAHLKCVGGSKTCSSIGAKRDQRKEGDSPLIGDILKCRIRRAKAPHQQTVCVSPDTAPKLVAQHLLKSPLHSMPSRAQAARMRRREFLAVSSQAAVGLPLLPVIACAQRKTSAKSNNKHGVEKLVADLEMQIPKLLEETVVPGFSMALVENAKVSWRRGFGFKENASKTPVEDKTIFQAQSMSKPVFAYAVMKLCEIGVMNLDTPLAQYVPKGFRQGDAQLELVTARHVLSHTSGLKNWQTEGEPLKIHFKPGEQFQYSGEGYSYLQAVVTHLTRQPIEEYMQANVFVPFGMAFSGYVWSERFERHAAVGHDRQGRSLKKSRPSSKNAARYAAASALHTTPTDYAKFMIEVINPKPADTFRLKHETVNEMLRPHVKVPNDPFSRSWALGWAVTPSEGGDIIDHGGSFRSFHAFAAAAIKRKAGFVMMTNSENGGELLKNLALGDLMQRFIN